MIDEEFFRSLSDSQLKQMVNGFVFDNLDIKLIYLDLFPNNVFSMIQPVVE